MEFKHFRKHRVNIPETKIKFTFLKEPKTSKNNLKIGITDSDHKFSIQPDSATLDPLYPAM